MTSDDGGVDATATVARLRVRLDRERRARREAESIAERSIRELWEANRRLESRVADGIVVAATMTRAVDRASSSRIQMIRRMLDDVGTAAVGGVESLTGPVTTDVLVISSIRPTEASEHLVARWVDRAASVEQTLVSRTHDLSPTSAHWDLVLAIGEILVSAGVRHGCSGQVRIELIVTQGDVVASVELPVPESAERATADQSSAPDAWRGFGRIGPDLAVAASLAVVDGGTLTARSDGDGWCRVVVRSPVC